MDPILDGMTNQCLQLFPIEYDEVSTSVTVLLLTNYSHMRYV